MPFDKKHVLMVKRVGEGGKRRNITNYDDVHAKVHFSLVWNLIFHNCVFHQYVWILWLLEQVKDMMQTEFPDEGFEYWDGTGDTQDVHEYSKLFANAKIVFGNWISILCSNLMSNAFSVN